MGNYYFTSAADGSKTKVEYTFGYKKNSDGEVRIFLHHSSVPFSPDPASGGATAISQEEVRAAQAAWANAIKTISKTCCDVDASSPSTGTAAAGSPWASAKSTSFFSILWGFLCLGWQGFCLAGARWMMVIIATFGVLAAAIPALRGAFFRNFGSGGWGRLCYADKGVNRCAGSRGKFGAGPRNFAVLLSFLLFQGCEAGRLDAPMASGADCFIAVAGALFLGYMAIAVCRMVFCWWLRGVAASFALARWLWSGSRHQCGLLRRRSSSLSRPRRSVIASSARLKQRVNRRCVVPHPWGPTVRNCARHVGWRRDLRSLLAGSVAFRARLVRRRRLRWSRPWRRLVSRFPRRISRRHVPRILQIHLLSQGSSVQSGFVRASRGVSARGSVSAHVRTLRSRFRSRLRWCSRAAGRVRTPGPGTVIQESQENSRARTQGPTRNDEESDERPQSPFATGPSGPSAPLSSHDCPCLRHGAVGTGGTRWLQKRPFWLPCMVGLRCLDCACFWFWNMAPCNGAWRTCWCAFGAGRHHCTRMHFCWRNLLQRCLCHRGRF